MSQVLSTMHDNNANSAKFTSKFNGDNRDTIRFIFAIQRYEDIANFQNPQSLFINIYNALPPHIQVEFAEDKNAVIDQQRDALDNNSTAEDRRQATIYTSASMQNFFMRDYRPTITRGNLFRQLHKIRMRKNENPRLVIDRMVQAIKYAKRTIELMNDTDTTGEEIQKIHHADITELFTRLFCSTLDGEELGEINKLMRKQFRIHKPKYANARKAYTPFYTVAETVVSELSTQWYSKDKDYKIIHYDPIPLPLWEATTTKIKKEPNIPKSFTPKQYTPKQTPSKRNKRPYYNPQYTPQSQPQRKRPRYNPQHKPSSNVQCFRCGKIGHTAPKCRSKTDINKISMRQWERRNSSQWYFRPSYPNKPKQPTSSSPSTSNKPNYYTPKFKSQLPTQWEQYPSTPLQIPSQTPSTHSHTPQPTSSSSATNPSNLFSLISELHNTASADAHINPDVMKIINQLQDTTNNSENPPPRQYQ